MGAAVDLQLLEGELEGQGIAVGALRRHRLECISEADDPHIQGDLAGGQPMGVARSIEALMVVGDDRQERIEQREVAGDPHPDRGVGLHHLVLLVSKLGCFVQDLLGDADLPDIVEEGSPGKGIERILAHLHRLPDGYGKVAHPQAVGLGVGVLLCDGLGERLKGSHAHVTQGRERFTEALCALVHRGL